MSVETGTGPLGEDKVAIVVAEGSINELEPDVQLVSTSNLVETGTGPLGEDKVAIVETGTLNYMIVELFTTISPNDRVVCKAALTLSRLPKPWKQLVNSKMFEVMHGLSRVTQLLPDKLATALAIYNENLPDPDDGKFLVQLVVDLTIFYKNKLINLTLPNVDNENIISRIEKVENEVNQEFKALNESMDLTEVLCDFLDKMVSMQTNLTLRNEDGVYSDAHEILQMADDILEFSIVFMDFVNPICLNVERKGFVDENRIQELKSELNNTLDKNKKKLQKEFILLTKPKITED